LRQVSCELWCGCNGGVRPLPAVCLLPILARAAPGMPAGIVKGIRRGIPHPLPAPTPTHLPGFYAPNQQTAAIGTPRREQKKEVLRSALSWLEENVDSTYRDDERIDSARINCDSVWLSHVTKPMGPPRLYPTSAEVGAGAMAAPDRDQQSTISEDEAYRLIFHASDEECRAVMGKQWGGVPDNVRERRPCLAPVPPELLRSEFVCEPPVDDEDDGDPAQRREWMKFSPRRRAVAAAKAPVEQRGNIEVLVYESEVFDLNVGIDSALLEEEKHFKLQRAAIESQEEAYRLIFESEQTSPRA